MSPVVAWGMPRTGMLLLLLGCQVEKEPRAFAQSDADEACKEMMALICASCEKEGEDTLSNCLQQVNCEAVKMSYGEIDYCIDALQTWTCGVDFLPVDCLGVVGY